ncbi:hypothetical protein COEREDRAFT_83756 [Coemansia reversa NRRL 1564]|uniref:HMA domain-containing protein n=1 Tax=Coemansia reversa (strain ATCC 12441 / NRRL 1564) TaxID=763665 RepID=A0A2G5B1Z7_COERN|nr:hypothetical protein COEREDRAFT_83756 [Coemansia reversa NRRL 1564]|eukprot:PIA13038.1 hypothetical protein COEREDRAFT_83756 [Coemansia reversa NRRL 1564]
MSCGGCSNAVDKALTNAKLLHEVVLADQLVVVRVQEPLKDEKAVDKKRNEILAVIKKTGKESEALPDKTEVKKDVLKSLDAKAAAEKEAPAGATSDQPAAAKAS